MGNRGLSRLQFIRSAFLFSGIGRNRFGYGRKWTIEKMKETIIKLLCLADGMPDFIYMENYIKSLPYSDRI